MSRGHPPPLIGCQCVFPGARELRAAALSGVASRINQQCPYPVPGWPLRYQWRFSGAPGAVVHQGPLLSS